MSALEVTNSKNMILEVLKKEAESNKAFAAVCMKFVKRQRTRGLITVRGLQLAMGKDGEHISRMEYQKILLKLSNLGFGDIKYDSKGEVVALANIKTTLQSIGNAALGHIQRIDRFTAKPKFEELSTGNTSKLAETYAASLTLKTASGKTIEISGVENLAPEDVAQFMIAFAQLRDSHTKGNA